MDSILSWSFFDHIFASRFEKQLPTGSLSLAQLNLASQLQGFVAVSGVLKLATLSSYLWAYQQLFQFIPDLLNNNNNYNFDTSNIINNSNMILFLATPRKERVKIPLQMMNSAEKTDSFPICEGTKNFSIVDDNGSASALNKPLKNKVTVYMHNLG